MVYDVALKVILSRCLPVVLEAWCGLDVERAEISEARPQETVSLRRADIVARVELRSGEEVLIVMELASRWQNELPLRLLEYRTRHKISEGMEVLSFLFLLRPSKRAVSRYTDREVDYRFRLIKLYEIDAEEVVRKGSECLLAFVPVMKGGERLWEEAEKKIYESNIEKPKKADLLMGMAILGGLVSPELTARLIARRRDMVIESAAYEIIKKEGFEEGMKLGIEQGIKQGIQRGLLIDAQEMVIDALEEKFGVVPRSITREIKAIDEREILKQLHRITFRVKDLEEFCEYMERLKS